MGIKEKIENAKPTDWLTKGLTDEEVKEVIEDAKCYSKSIYDLPQEERGEYFLSMCKGMYDDEELERRLNILRELNGRYIK